MFTAHCYADRRFRCRPRLHAAFGVYLAAVAAAAATAADGSLRLPKGAMLILQYLTFPWTFGSSIKHQSRGLTLLTVAISFHPT